MKSNMVVEVHVDRIEAWQGVMRLRKEEFEEKISPQKLPKDRQNLLFQFIKGEIQINHACSLDLEAYALKYLMPEVYASLPKIVHAYSNCALYEYDPQKNGQNIIKHGIGFGEVVSYSRRFGALMVPVPNDIDKERYVVFSDLLLKRDSDELALPPPKIRELNYTISIVQQKHGKFRFISSRLMSSKMQKCRNTIAQAFGEIIADEQAKMSFIDRCLEIVETRLFRKFDDGKASPGARY